MASYTVNPRAVAHAKKLIDGRQYVLDSDWGEVQPSADDENAFLDRHSWDGSPVTVRFAATPMTDADACEIAVTVVNTDGQCVSVETESVTDVTVTELTPQELPSLFQGERAPSRSRSRPTAASRRR